MRSSTNLGGVVRPEVLAFPLAVLAFVTVLGAVQDTEIRDATVAVAPKTIAVQTVTIGNRRQSQLLAWPISTAGVTGTTITSTH